MLQTTLTALFGAGIMMLLTVQVLIASGLNKRDICALSTIGIAPCLLAASLMGNWKLFAIALPWLIICAWGSPIIERRDPPGRSDQFTLLVASLPLMAWIALPSYLIWTAVASLQLVWLLFAWGLACRPIYLLSITAAAMPLIPSLVMKVPAGSVNFDAALFGACAYVLLWVYVAAARTRSRARPLW